MKNNPLYLKKKTKVIATLGPASANEDTLSNMMQLGANVIRINASHAKSDDDIREKIDLVRRVSDNLGLFVGVFVDLQGPKIRVGNFENDEITLAMDDTFIITTDPMMGTQSKASVDYKDFAKDVSEGELVYIDDGRVHLVVTKIDGNDVTCKVTQGGKVSNHKGVNLPHTKLSMPAMTQKDFNDAKVAVEAGVDYVALSFVSCGEDVLALRRYLDECGGDKIRIISKIELQTALDHIEEVIDASDAVMVARGDLGVEVGIQNVPKAQKNIIELCNSKVRPVIVATQMLESMIQSKMATRAEVSDVANAIYDGCDAVMLSGETAVGISPETVIKTITEICLAADTHLDDMQLAEPVKKRSFHDTTPAMSFCQAADQIANKLDATAILSFTSSGNTPLRASKLKTPRPILAPTDNKKVCTRISLYRGITPLYIPENFTELGRWTNMINVAIRECKQLDYLQEGDVIIITAGIPVGVSNGINSIRMVVVKNY